MRNAFIDELIAIARTNKNLVLMVGDLGYSVVEPFRDEFPDRFFNAGVAEQNMVGMAAGLASEGCHVFVYSIANFPTFRCAEQIRNDVDYHNLPVTVVAVGGGLSYGNLGYSHHAIQDYALMRIMPNMLIASPGDPMEVRGCMKYLVEHPQPSYLRLGKAGEPTFHHDIPEVNPGMWLPVYGTSSERDEVILTTGATLRMVMEAIRDKKTSASTVYSMPLWSMKSKCSQAIQVSQYTKISTVEDHLLDGGFGSWLLESCQEHPHLMARIKSIALNSDVCGMVGSQDRLNYLGGIRFD